MAGRTVRCPECDGLVDVPPVTDEVRDGEGMAGAGPEPPDRADREVSRASGVGPGTAAGVAAALRGAGSAAAPNRTDPLPATGGFPPDPTPDGDAPVGSGGVGGSDGVETVLMHEADEDEAAFRRPPREEEELDMTPMVDVTFLLLIFFMVTASFSLQKSIQMPRQTSDLPSVSPLEEETDELDPVELEIDEFGGFYVITADFEEETPGKQNLIRTLKRAIGSATEGMQLKIRVHEMAKLQALVDAMDAGTIAGFAEIQVDQVEDL